MPKLGLTADQLLSTTRSVRKRLDISRPVERAVIEECLNLALQAPNGGNRNLWRWIVVDDPAKVAAIGAQYKAMFDQPLSARSEPIPDNVERFDLVHDSVRALVEKIDHMPALLIPLMPGRAEGKTPMQQAVMWGSIVQAVWSFFLALRERGLGSAWTTVSLGREREIAEILGIPFESYTQVGLFPIAYTQGTDFKPAWREPLAEVLDYNGFTAR
ncbi:nitroreductase family protein [Novosphingobium bradum]|uniref:Nitroreductase family protein n=1 Tax=Novosphingobium bradum TaxID=1737444 RepID=A0ABV7IPH8_9SPHN